MSRTVGPRDALAELRAVLAPGSRGGVLIRPAPPSPEALQALHDDGVRVAVLEGLASGVAWFAALAEGLVLPAWFGRNLDALEETLARPEASLAGPLLLVWVAPGILERAEPRTAAALRSVLEDAARERADRGQGPLVAWLVGDVAGESSSPGTGQQAETVHVPVGAAVGGRAMSRRSEFVPEAVRRLGRIHHVAVVVRDMPAALGFWRDALGLAPGPVVPIPPDRVEIAFLPVGDVKVELVRPTDDTTGVARFLESKGEGFHHICFEVPNIAEALLRLEIEGIQLIDTAARPGAEGPVAFLHPKSCHGVLVELIEEPGGPSWTSLYPKGFRPPGG